MQIKFRHLRHGIALFVLCFLLLGPIFATSRPAIGLWRDVAAAPGALPPFVGLSMSVEIREHRLVQKTNNVSLHHTPPPPQAQVQSRGKRRVERLKRIVVKKVLHEVPSGANPISNEIPTKLVDAQKVPNSMP
ncbi:hypothetical protein GOP47_0022897 [Adiantum capillus-veneris]|uniref:Transmembrane protein n=1 Tax=Adiantum capillus-veneris TaxID=13818 RepID=A0A9D4U7D0_ADICA|nr:hypothetical protein GOP47_0022897 [Adiantum capillus-veneris]